VKMLVTGTGGFIGQHVLKAVINKFGAENIVIVGQSLHPACETFLCSYENGMINSNCESLNEIETMLLIGGWIPKTSADTNNVASAISNITFTKNILNLSCKNLSKIIYVSTVDVYGDAPAIDENSATNANGLYGASKLFCEKVVVQDSIVKNIESQILRIGHVYGPGEELYQKLIPTVITKALVGENIEIWGDGSDLRSFIYISDVVEIILNALTIQNPPSLVNVAGGTSMSILDVVKIIKKISMSSSEIFFQEAQTKKRNLVFNNERLMTHYLDSETTFAKGISCEIEHMVNRS